MNAIGFILAGVGIFSMCGAVLDWDWFMNHPKARLFTKIFGRPGARVFYVLLGLALVVLGGLVVAGVIDISP